MANARLRALLVSSLLDYINFGAEKKKKKPYHGGDHRPVIQAKSAHHPRTNETSQAYGDQRQGQKDRGGGDNRLTATVEHGDAETWVTTSLKRDWSEKAWAQRASDRIH